MKIENNKIIEATESELYSHWLKSGYENIYSFNEYLVACIKTGTKVTDISEEEKGRLLFFH